MHQQSPAILDLAPIRSMEPHIRERLAIGFPDRHFTIERVPATVTPNEFERVAKLSPFIGLAWTGISPAQSSGRRLRGSWEWRLLLVVKAAGSDDVRFRGDAFDIGLDAMTDVAVALLHGWSIDEIGACSVTSSQAIFAEGQTDDSVVLALVNFQIDTLISPANFKLVTEQDLAQLDVAWLANPQSEADGQFSPPQTIEVPQEEA
ncbi:MAG: hypothetical protein OXR62_10895 [Ahrensia sp.]|nr:hypothetical protein [Ahrensia sp.]